MNWRYNVFSKPEYKTFLKAAEHGLEKESLRVTNQGALSQKPHPKPLGSILCNPYITADFSEAQPELVTTHSTNIKKTLKQLHELHQFVVKNLDDEMLWPASTPCRLPDESLISIANFGSSDKGTVKNIYRLGLSHRYGKKMQTLSGIHYNFSFSKEFIALLHKDSLSSLSLKDFTSDLYLHICRNFLRFGYLYTYLFGATPALDRSFLSKEHVALKSLDAHTLYGEFATSLRLSKIGYYSPVQEQLAITYNSMEEYLKGLESAITTENPEYKKIGLMQGARQIQCNTNNLQIEGEHYSRIRPKPRQSNSETVLESLKKDGIGYVEVRVVDLNPHLALGIDETQIHFIQMLLLLCLVKESPPIQKDEQQQISDIHESIALQGRKSGIMPKEAESLLNEMQSIGELLDGTKKEYTKTLKLMQQALLDPEKTPSALVLGALQTSKKSFQDYCLELARKHKQTFLRKSFMAVKKYEKVAMRSLIEQEELEYRDALLLKGYEDMEFSTQLVIREAKRRGIKVDVLDRADNFIRLEKLGKVELVKQATQTSRDHLVSYMAMENKHVTKELLKEKGIHVPIGKIYTDEKSALADYATHSLKKVVVKPNFTNFGHGITFVEPNCPKDYEFAVKHAFAHNDEVLVEEFARGEEYRLLVIDGRVAAVCQRLAANVVGDGIHTIKELVRKKNTNPKSFKPYKYAIKIGKAEKYKLKEQGLTELDVPKKGVRVFLRNNSNVSTGGDPVDRTSVVPYGFHEIAVEAAKAVGAVFCGVDMLIDKLDGLVDASNYTIIELNFNPAIFMHRFPEEGKGVEVEKAVLDALGL